ncbi:phage tail tape measure protein, partial [Pseudomonas aeruginosa]
MANDLQLRVLAWAIDRATAPLRRIMQGSDATARALKAIRERLEAAQRLGRATWCAFPQLQRGYLEQVSTALEAAQQARRVKALAQQMAAATPPARWSATTTGPSVKPVSSSSSTCSTATPCSNCARPARRHQHPATSASSERDQGRRSRRPMAPSTAVRSATQPQPAAGARLTQARPTTAAVIQSAAALAGTGMA